MSIASRTGEPGGWNAPQETSGGGAASASPALIQLVLLIAVPFCLQSVEGERVLVAMLAASLLFTLISFAPVAGLPAVFIYLVMLGGVRRWIVPILGFTTNDPLVMVSTVVASLYFAGILIRRAIPRDTPISKTVLALLVVMVLEIFNPLQGGLVVGLAGGIFYIVPIFWYYVGRNLVTDLVAKRLLATALVVSVFVGLYGAYQQFVGFLPTELAYIQLTHYNQNLSDSISRVFSTLTSFAEYEGLISIGIAISFALILRKHRIALLPFLFLTSMMLLSSSRGGVVNSLFACTALWAIQGKTVRSWLPRIIVAVVVGMVGLFFSLHQLQDTSFIKNKSTASQLLGHTVSGLSDPFGKGQDTTSHVTLQTNGILSGFTRPLGLGTGATTLASARYGTGEIGSAEGDLGNAFISLGLIGGILYIVFAYRLITTAGKNWHERRDDTSLMILGTVVVMFGQWFSGGEYSCSLLVWVLFGYVDRACLIRETRPKAAVR
jgi:hypothetical protein